MIERQRLAQFGFASYRVSDAKQRQAQQIPRLGQIGIHLQRILDLNDGRLGIILGKVIARGCKHRIRPIPAACSQQQGHRK